MEETLFDFKENSKLEPYDILNKVINFLETEFDKESKNVIHIYNITAMTLIKTARWKH